MVKCNKADECEHKGCCHAVEHEGTLLCKHEDCLHPVGISEARCTEEKEESMICNKVDECENVHCGHRHKHKEVFTCKEVGCGGKENSICIPYKEESMYYVLEPKSGYTKFEHANYGDAQKEAERLALKESDKEFLILKAVKKCKIGRVVWEDV